VPLKFFVAGKTTGFVELKVIWGDPMVNHHHEKPPFGEYICCFVPSKSMMSGFFLGYVPSGKLTCNMIG